MIDFSIRPRLKWFAKRVREGVLFVDIGTDHAKLPVYLVKSGIVSKAIASDIGEGPIERARMHISANGLNDKISTFVGDGMSHLNIAPPADIAICGMGGETIINIIKAAEFVKDGSIRLMLQPMTDFSMLRYFLAENGFTVCEEDIVASDGRMYQCLIVCYTGEKYSLNSVEAELGRFCIEKHSETFLRYVKHRHNIVSKCIKGKQKANIDVSDDTALLLAYENILRS